MELKRNYLTSEELSFILNEMNKYYNDAITREVVKVALVGQCVIDSEDIKSMKTCNEIYDFIMANNINVTKVVNYKILDKAYAESNNTIKKTLEMVVNKIDEDVKKLDSKAIISSLQELQKQGVDVDG